MRQLFHPSSFCIIQPFLKSTYYDLVNSFSLFVPLKICQSGVPVCNFQLTTVSPKGFAIELESIVRDEGMGYLEVSDNVFPEKLLCVHISDIHQRFSFDPFGEIICADQQILLISCCFRKWANNEQCLSLIVQKAKDWRGGLKILPVGVCLVQIFDTDRISSHTLMPPFAYLAPSNLG